MYCKKCGSALNENDLFCTQCGEKVVYEETNETVKVESEVNSSQSSLNEYLNQQQNNNNVDNKNKKAIMVLIILISILIVLGIVVGILVIPKLINDKPGENISSNTDQNINQNPNTSQNQKPNTNENKTSTFVYSKETGKTVHFNVPSSLSENKDASDFEERKYEKTIQGTKIEVLIAGIYDNKMKEIFDYIDKDEKELYESIYSDVSVSDIKTRVVDGKEFKYKKLTFKYLDEEYSMLYFIYEIDNKSMYAVEAAYAYLTDSEVEAFLKINVKHLDDILPNTSGSSKNTYIFNEDSCEKIYFNMAADLKEGEESDYTMRFIEKKIESYDETIAAICIRGYQTVEEYFDEAGKFVSENSSYSNVKLSEIQTKVVNDREFKYRTLSFTGFGTEWYKMYAVTELNDDNIYVVEFDYVDKLTEAEIDSLLTITIVK